MKIDYQDDTSYEDGYREYDYINDDYGFIYDSEDEVFESDISFFSGDAKCSFCMDNEADLRFKGQPICIDCMCLITDKSKSKSVY
jgi:hypothetical protein